MKSMRMPSSFPEIPLLRAEHVLLRGPRPADAPAIARACQDRAVLDFVHGVPRNYSLEDARALIDRKIYERWKQDYAACFIAADARTDRCIGNAALVPLASLATAELVFWMVPGERSLRRSIALLKLICEFGFDELRLQRIEAYTDVRNRTAIQMGLRAGFRHEGIARAKLVSSLDGTRHDAHAVSMLPGELMA